MILTPLQKLSKNVGDVGKLIVAKGFKNLTKVQKIAQSGHTDYLSSLSQTQSVFQFLTVHCVANNTPKQCVKSQYHFGIETSIRSSQRK